MSNLRIRNVLPSDLERVTEIEATCFPAVEAAPGDSFKSRISVFPGGFFVAELDNKIIGFINGGATDESHIEDEFFGNMKLHKDDGKNLVIFGLDVHPEYQGKGFAKELMLHFIEEAKKSGKEKVLLTCKEHLIGYYEQFGYVNEGVSESQHGGAKWYDMSLELK